MMPSIVVMMMGMFMLPVMGLLMEHAAVGSANVCDHSLKMHLAWSRLLQRMP